MAREEAGHSDGRSDVLRGGEGLEKASCINGVISEIDAAASTAVNESVITADINNYTNRIRHRQNSTTPLKLMQIESSQMPRIASPLPCWCPLRFITSLFIDSTDATFYEALENRPVSPTLAAFCLSLSLNISSISRPSTSLPSFISSIQMQIDNDLRKKSASERKTDSGDRRCQEV
ncbi:hypothetical protein PUN28_001999 [Cardiocondyla obscurior]|uniref:Uncharacterized protein n=1 Tax=Cardiocondyla obscurior TaxID=286306 RepID=A0AAW2GS05_9HYME